MAKVLYVEDNPANRRMLGRRLQRLGYEISFAEDGKEGIDTVKAETPDIILMDMSMPVMDGWEAAGHLKADDTTKHIPIIGLTSHAMTGDREKCLEAGCDEYETKPVDMDTLVEKMKTLLNE